VVSQACQAIRKTEVILLKNDIGRKYNRWRCLSPKVMRRKQPLAPPNATFPSLLENENK
jgi:hypothetical protein